MLRRKRQAAKTETAQSNSSVGTSLHRSSYYGIISGKTILINIQIIPIFELDFDVMLGLDFREKPFTRDHIVFTHQTINMLLK